MSHSIPLQGSSDHQYEDDKDSNSLAIRVDQVNGEDPGKDERFHQVVQVYQQTQPNPDLDVSRMYIVYIMYIREGLTEQALSKSWHCQKGGGGGI